MDVEPVRDRGKMFHARVGGAKNLPEVALGDGLQPKGRSKTHGGLHLNRRFTRMKLLEDFLAPIRC